MEYFKKKLYVANDGKDLILAATVPTQNQWLSYTNQFISGRDYINYVKFRINALPSRVRVSRGSSLNKLCSACNTKTETTYHVIQGCSRTHGMRIKRHDTLVKFIANINTSGGKRVIVEPHIKTDSGLRKPYIIIIDGAQATVVDVQIVSYDNNRLNTFHNNKVNYYKNNSDLINMIKSDYCVSEVDVAAVTIHYKGPFNSISYKRALELDILKPSDIKLIVNKVLLGGILCFKSFYSATFK